MRITISTDELVSVRDVAEALGWTKMRVYRWVDAGKIVGLELGGILLIPSSELERLKNETNKAQVAQP